MIRNYKNEKIYNNFKKTKTLALISTIIAIISIIILLIDESMGRLIIKGETNSLFVCIFILLMPLNILIFSIKANKQPLDGRIVIKETSLNNDLSNLSAIIAISFMDFYFLIFFSVICLISGSWGLILVWADYEGFMFLSRLFSYIADIFLIKNYILIKKEWQENPPEYEIQDRIEKEKRQAEELYNKNLGIYEKLIEKCGAKFFIKYYKQIDRLTIRDVIIQENYSLDEKEERLHAAKKIIESGLAEFTLNQILVQFCDMLDETEIMQAKVLLKELENEKNSR